MNATEIIARLIDSKAINGEEAMCLTNAMSPKLVQTEPYSPNYKCNYDFWWMNPLNRPSSAIANPKSTICEGICSSASTISLNEDKEQIIIDGWVARDKNNVLCLFNDKPFKRDVEWDCGIHVEPMLIESKFFPEIKWEDEEPTKVKLIIEKV